jgi:hypothetical protein
MRGFERPNHWNANLRGNFCPAFSSAKRTTSSSVVETKVEILDDSLDQPTDHWYFSEFGPPQVVQKIKRAIEL